jgi:hypothetical protein
VESTARQEYEFTTPRIVLLVVAILLWLLLGVGAMARDDDGSGSYRFGLLLGSLIASLLLSWIVRSLYRLIRRRPVLSPAWTPGLFFGAVVVQILSAAGNSS